MYPETKHVSAIKTSFNYAYGLNCISDVLHDCESPQMLKWGSSWLFGQGAMDYICSLKTAYMCKLME